MNWIFINTNSGLAIPNNQLVQLPVPKSWGDMASLATFPNFSGFTDSHVWITGITIAIVASIETLLSIEAADRLDVHRRITDTNRELRAQALATWCAPLLAGCL